MNRKILQGLIRPRVDRLATQVAVTLWARFEAQLDEALAVAHSALLSDLEAPVVHRDVRPAKVIRGARRRRASPPRVVAPTVATPPRAPTAPTASAARARVPHNKGAKIVCTVCREPGHNARRHKGDAAPAAPAPPAEPAVRAPRVVVQAPTTTPAPRARRRAAEVEAAPEPVVIPRSELAARLAADRATAAGGDAGGYRARPDRAPPIVGAVLSTDRREVCRLHGWVGRLSFQRDRHDLCPAPTAMAELDNDDQADGAEG